MAAAVTFSGAALGLLGGTGGPQQEILKETKEARRQRKKQLENDEKMIRELQRMVPAVFT